MAAPGVKKPRAGSPSRKRGMRLRSGLEAVVEGLLHTSQLPYHYEDTILEYLQPAQTRKYLPDFRLDLGTSVVFLEVKGYLTSADRKKLKLIKEQHPNTIVILVFGNSGNRLNKKSPTTYSMWCDKNNIPWIDVKDLKGKDLKQCLLSLIQKQTDGKSKIPRKKNSKP